MGMDHLDAQERREQARSIIRQVATSLMRSIADNPSKLRLLRLDIRGWAAWLCFPRGLSYRSPPLVFDGRPPEIQEGLAQYHFPEYHPLPSWLVGLHIEVNKRLIMF